MNGKTIVASLFYVISLVFFVLGLLYPIMSSDVLMGLISDQKIYLMGSVTLFFEKGEFFLGTLILMFSIVFPAMKYVVIGLKIGHVKFPGHQQFNAVLDFINKWAMLDVFVVALVIINMKMGHSVIISTNIENGTTFFAASIVLLMISNWILKRRIVQEAVTDAIDTPRHEVAPMKEATPKTDLHDGENPNEIS